MENFRSKKAGTSLSDLPSEIIDHIFSYVPRNNYKNLHLTCSLFSKIIDEQILSLCKTIPWKISVEYHFINKNFFIHQVNIFIGYTEDSFFETNEQVKCKFCQDQFWNYTLLSTRPHNDENLVGSNTPGLFFEQNGVFEGHPYIDYSDIKMTEVSGFGIDREFLINPKIPLWLMIYPDQKLIVPYSMSKILKPLGNETNQYFFDHFPRKLGNLHPKILHLTNYYNSNFAKLCPVNLSSSLVPNRKANVFDLDNKEHNRFLESYQIPMKNFNSNLSEFLTYFSCLNPELLRIHIFNSSPKKIDEFEEFSLIVDDTDSDEISSIDYPDEDFLSDDDFSNFSGQLTKTLKKFKSEVFELPKYKLCNLYTKN